MWKQEGHLNCCAITFHSLVRKIWKKSSSGGPWQPIVFNPLYWGTPIGCLHCSILWGGPWGVGAARLSTSIELRVIHLDSKFTGFLVHSKFNWEHQGAQLPPNKTQLIACKFAILHMTYGRKNSFLSQVNLNLIIFCLWWFDHFFFAFCLTVGLLCRLLQKFGVGGLRRRGGTGGTYRCNMFDVCLAFA